MAFMKKAPAKKNTKGGENTPAKARKKPMKIARTAQEIIDFDYITEDGIIISGNYYSKLYKLIDSNFVTEPEDKQVDYLVNYTKLMNRFPDNVDISVIIINERNTKEDITAAYHLKEAGDGLDEYRTDYNHIIDKKIEEGHNEISKEKYIMLTIRTANGLSQAEMEFNSADVSLQEAVKTINKVGVKQLYAIDRLAVMQKILRGSDCVPFHKEYERYFAKHKDDEGNEKLSLDLPALRKSGVSVKDLIAPQVIAKTRQCIQLDDERYCKSYAYANLPQQLDTSFLTNVTNLPYEMVTVIQFKPVPRKKALQLVKMQNTSVKADVIKASQQAYKSGYSTDLINEDLIQAREDAGKLRHDVVNEGKKLFFATMVVSIFGKDDDEIKNITAQYTAKCADYSVTPSYLIGQQVAGLNTAILCGNSKVIIDRMLTSDNACALFPFNIQELTDKKGHFYGSNAISKNMVMYDRKRSRLANGLIFGQSGSGKSFITKGEIIPNLLDGNDDMIILDPENEYHVVAEHFGGRTIDLELKSQYHINPCDMAMEWDDPKATPLAEKCDYMVGLVESILGKGRECNIYETNAIHRACTRMYEDYIEEMTRRHRDGCEEGQSDELDTEICPTLVEFYNELMADGTQEGTKVALAVEQYCIGNYNVFAHHTNIEGHSRLTIYNLLYLPEKMTEMAMKVCLSNIWTKIVKNREENEKYHTGKAIWVYLDEFHHFFKTESSASTVMAYYKRVRKYGGIMTGITQDVADLLSTRQGTAMFNNTGFFIFLNQSPIGRQQLQNLYGISDALIDYIKDKPSGTGLIYNNSVIIPIDYKLPTDSELYHIMSTNPNDEARKTAIKRKANEEFDGEKEDEE